MLVNQSPNGQILNILDLYCGAGGASYGYYLGAVHPSSNYTPNIIGVDNVFKKDYPFIFMKYDVLELIKAMPKKWWRQFDLIHASPPCQHYSITKNLCKAQNNKVSDIDHVPIIRKFLKSLDIPYVIENVVGSGLDGAVICGSSFGLGVRRHRIFETNFPLASSVCNHKEQGRPIGVYGSMNDAIPSGGKTAVDLAEGQSAMGIDWCGWSNLKEAVPPKFTMYVFYHYRRFRLLELIA